MIERVWSGWARDLASADQYQEFLQTQFLPTAHELDGYRGAHVLRRNFDGGVEFVTITKFESVDAIKGFAGDDWEKAHVAPEAQRLLARWDQQCRHYEVAFDDEPAA